MVDAHRSVASGTIYDYTGPLGDELITQRCDSLVYVHPIYMLLVCVPFALIASIGTCVCAGEVTETRYT